VIKLQTGHVANRSSSVSGVEGFPYDARNQNMP